MSEYDPESPDPFDPSDATEMTAEQLAEAKEYGRQELYCTLIDKGLDLVYLTVMALMAGRPLDEWLKGFDWLGRFATLRLAAMFVIVTLLHALVSLPLSYYSGHVFEHRYHLSTLSFGSWLWRYGKRLLLGGLLGMAMVLGLYGLIWTTGAWWWLVAAGAFFLVSVLLGQLAPVLILPLFYKIERIEDPELSERLARLAEGTGLAITGVFRMTLSAETVKANAMLAGLGRTRRVILGDTLLEGFSAAEIEVIFAHEIGHHVHRHIRKLILSGLLYSTAGLWICDRLLTLGAGKAGFDYTAMPVAMLPAITLILTVFAMIVEPLGNFVSRRFERQADRYALARTQNSPAYVSAFRKLAKLNKDDPSPPWLEVVLFHSHPPIAERIAYGTVTEGKA